jgi:hypothetical protein
MHQIEDPLTIVADLEPARLSQLAEEGYDRCRADDLARALAEPGGPLRVARPRRAGRRASGQPRLAIAAAGLTAAAAAAAAVLIAAPSPATPGRPPASGTGTPKASLEARTVLLASAHAAARAVASTGTYWYVRERDFEPTGPSKGGAASRPKTKHAMARSFGAYYAATEETWIGQARSRTIVNENLAFSFASAADEARWKAAGEPELANPAGKFGRTGPATSDYNFGGYWYRQGGIQLNLKPGTRAAIYRLLAAQQGLTVVPRVTDPLGRTGTAISDGKGNYIVIDPASGQILDATTYQVQAGGTIPATRGGTEAYEATGWTSRLGTPSAG